MLLSANHTIGLMKLSCSQKMKALRVTFDGLIKLSGSLNVSFKASNASHTVVEKLKELSFFPCFVPLSRLVRDALSPYSYGN